MIDRYQETHGSINLMQDPAPSLFVTRNHVSLIDKDYGRRASLSAFFRSLGWHAEPYDGIEEFAHRRRGATLIAVFDTGDEVDRIFDVLARDLDWVPIVAYSDTPDPCRVADVIFRGAIDYFALPFDWEKVLHRLEISTDRGGSLAQIRRKWVQARGKISRLSMRERQVLDLMAEGNSNKEIGRELALSPRTVEIHRANMMNKLNASHAIDAVRVAVHSRIYEEPETVDEERAKETHDR